MSQPPFPQSHQQHPPQAPQRSLPPERPIFGITAGTALKFGFFGAFGFFLFALILSVLALIIGLVVALAGFDIFDEIF